MSATPTHRPDPRPRRRRPVRPSRIAAARRPPAPCRRHRADVERRADGSHDDRHRASPPTAAPRPSPSTPRGRSCSRSTTSTPPRSPSSRCCRGDRILGEKENLPPGFSGSFSLQLGPGTYELYCPGADTERSEFTLVGELDQSAPTDVAGVLAEGADGYLGYVPQPGDRDADGGRRARRRDPDRRRRGVQARLHPGPAVLRADRAGGRVVRARRPQPRRRHRPAGRRRGADRSRGLPPHRVRAVDRREHRRPRRRVGAARHRRRQPAAADRRARRAAGVRPRQRRRRPARRGRVGQDHRRGGALLAHRPARPGRQRGRRRSRPSPTSRRA